MNELQITNRNRKLPLPSEVKRREGFEYLRWKPTAYRAILALLLLWGALAAPMYANTKAVWGFNNNALDASGYGFNASLHGNAAYSTSYTSQAEAELVAATNSSGDAFTVNADANCSNGQFGYLNANAVGDYVEYTVNVPMAGTYAVSAGNKTGYNRSIYQLSIGGVNQGPVVDQYSVNGTYPVSNLGSVTIASTGNKTFRFTVTGKNSSSSGYGIAIDYITLTASYSDKKEGTSSLSLDGNGDYASSGLVSGSTNNVSLGAWVKWNGNTGANQQIVYNGNTTLDGYGICLNSSQGNKLAILCGAKATLQSQTTLTPGQWTHVLAVRRSGTWELCVDGGQVAITNNATAPNTPTGGTYVGANQSGTEGFKGLADDVRIFDHAISDLEIADLIAEAGDCNVKWGFNNSGADSSGNGLNATCGGNATYNTDKKEGTHSLILDGNGDHASSGLVSVSTNNVSLGAWVKWNGNTGANQQIVYNGNTTLDGYGIYLNSSQGNKLAILCGAKATLQSQTVLTTGQWTHVLAVRRNGIWELYVNGTPVVITNNTTIPNAPSGGTYVGANQSGTEGFKGLADDVTIYGKAISDLEIAELIAASGDCKVRWAFNNDGTDASGNNLNALCYGNAAYNPTDKKEGTHSLSLDGSGDYAGASLATSLTDNITMGAWVHWSGSTSANQQIIYNGTTTSNGYGIYINNAQGNKLAVLCGAKATLQSQTVLPTGQWTRVVAVRRSGTWELYVNGSPVVITNNATVPNTPLGGTYVGANESGTEGFWGLVDDVVIYERALSVNEITALTDFYAFTPGTVKPLASSDLGGPNIGPRIPLTRYDGDVTIGAGQTVSGLDIYGRVIFTGAGTLRDCKIRGLTSYTGESSIIRGPAGQDYDLKGGLVEWCSIDATGRESIWIYGIWGGNYTCRYTEITATTDGIHANLIGNATIENCRMHNGYFYSWHNDATGGVQPGFPTSPSDHRTHSDAIQLCQCSGWVIRGNYLGGTAVPNSTASLDPTVPADATIIAQMNAADDYTNANIMIGVASIPLGALIEKNWFYGSSARINMDVNTTLPDYLNNVTIRDNKYIRSDWSGSGGYYIYMDNTCQTVLSNNVFADNGLAVPVTIYGTNPPSYAITASASPSGSGTVTGSGSYVSGTNLTLWASPAAGYGFVSWSESGTTVGASESYSLTVTRPRTLVANFAPSTTTAWKSVYFTVGEQNNAIISGNAGNPDGDSYCNLLEYALGMNPKVADNPPQLDAEIVGGYLTLTYQRNKTVSDMAYIVEVSSNLQTWSSGPLDVSWPTVLADDGYTQTVQVHDLTPSSSAARRYIRLRVTDVNSLSDTPVLGVDKPGPTNTGYSRLPAPGDTTWQGVTLTTYTGPTNITTNGTVIENKRIDVDLKMSCSNWIIRNCDIRGALDYPAGTGSGKETALVDCRPLECVGGLIEWSDIHQRNGDASGTIGSPNLWRNGIIGHGVTVRYCHIYNCVDAIGIYNNNTGYKALADVVFEQNWCGKYSFFAPDPAHVSTDNVTHNDGVQIHGGRNIQIRGNFLDWFAAPATDFTVSSVAGGAYQSALNFHTMLDATGAKVAGVDATATANRGGGQGIYMNNAIDSSTAYPSGANIQDVLIANNWFSGGGSQLGLKQGGPTIVVQDNRFDKTGKAYTSGSIPSRYQVRTTQTILDSVTGNIGVWNDTGVPVTVGNNRDDGIRTN